MTGKHDGFACAVCEMDLRKEAVERRWYCERTKQYFCGDCGPQHFGWDKPWRVVYCIKGATKAWRSESLEQCRKLIAVYGDRMHSYAIQRCANGVWRYAELRKVSGDNWCSTCGKKPIPEGAVDCAVCQQWWIDNPPPLD